METIEVKRTQGVWECGYGDNSKSFGIFTKKMLDEGLEESPICLISPIDKMNETDKANGAFICKAVNNYDSLLNALKEVIKQFPVGQYNVKKDFEKLVALAAASKAIYKTEEQ